MWHSTQIGNDSITRVSSHELVSTVFGVREHFHFHFGKSKRISGQTTGLHKHHTVTIYVETVWQPLQWNRLNRRIQLVFLSPWIQNKANTREAPWGRQAEHRADLNKCHMCMWSHHIWAWTPCVTHHGGVTLNMCFVSILQCFCKSVCVCVPAHERDHDAGKSWVNICKHHKSSVQFLKFWNIFCCLCRFCYFITFQNCFHKVCLSVCSLKFSNFNVCVSPR